MTEPPSECPHCGAESVLRSIETPAWREFACSTLLYDNGSIVRSSECWKRQLAAKDAALKAFETDVMKCRASAMSFTKDPSEIVCDLVGELAEARRQLQSRQDCLQYVRERLDEITGGTDEVRPIESVARGAVQTVTDLRRQLQEAREECERLRAVLVEARRSLVKSHLVEGKSQFTVVQEVLNAMDAALKLPS